MAPTSEVTKIHQGDKVKVKVVKMVSSGAIVQLECGVRGIIRDRELSWKRSLKDSERTVTVGDELEVLVLQVGRPGGLSEFSLKRISGDPWEEVEVGKYSVGSIVVGEVVNLESYGAFVELEPGIDGLVHISSVPGGQDKEIQDLLWIGDQIEAIITAIDHEKRHISLSIIERLEKRKHPGTALTVGTTSPASGNRTKVNIPQQFPAALGMPIHQVRVLVVDDDVEFAKGFAEWLERLGYQVDVAHKGAEVSATTVYHFVFVDLELPDTDGLKLTEHLLSRNPQTVTVLITGLDWFEQSDQASERLRARAVLLKPLDYGEVLQFLTTGRLAEATSQSLPEDDEKLELFSRVSTSHRESRGMYAKLSQLLDDLRAESRADVALIFEVDPPTHRISIVASSGFDASCIEQGELQSLRFSPVRNVALDREQLQETDVTSFSKFNKLLQLFYFESCVAVPVPTIGHDARYALFLFDPNPDQTLSVHRVYALSVSYFIATAIREEQVNSLVRAAQKSILLGQLASGMLHELRNHVGRVEQYARNLELDCYDFAQTPQITSPAVWADRFQKRVQGILDTNTALRGIISEHLGLMGKEKLEVVDINALLDKTVRQVAPLARESRVKVIPKLDARVPRTVAIPLQLEQVFLNLALNATQQMGVQTPKGGCLQIASLYDRRDADLPIKVRFSDDGPGVHRTLWDWIFEMGTSTRDGGTGLGLFVSKNLIERMGGRVSVEQSRMFVGSTFLIELPVTAAKEAADA